jgi:hypothetical protein
MSDESPAASAAEAEKSQQAEQGGGGWGGWGLSVFSEISRSVRPPGHPFRFVLHFLLVRVLT